MANLDDVRGVIHVFRRWVESSSLQCGGAGDTMDHGQEGPEVKIFAAVYGEWNNVCRDGFIGVTDTSSLPLDMSVNSLSQLWRDC